MWGASQFSFGKYSVACVLQYITACARGSCREIAPCFNGHSYLHVPPCKIGSPASCLETEEESTQRHLKSGLWANTVNGRKETGLQYGEWMHPLPSPCVPRGVLLCGGISSCVDAWPAGEAREDHGLPREKCERERAMSAGRMRGRQQLVCAVAGGRRRPGGFNTALSTAPTRPAQPLWSRPATSVDLDIPLERGLQPQ